MEQLSEDVRGLMYAVRDLTEQSSKEMDRTSMVQMKTIHSV